MLLLLKLKRVENVARMDDNHISEILVCSKLMEEKRPQDRTKLNAKILKYHP